MDNKKYNDIMPEIVNITEENLKEYADQLQFDTLAQECIIEDLCKSYNISKDDMFLLIHELKNRGYNVVTKNTNAHLETEGIILPETSNITLVRNFGHESLVDDLNYEITDNDENVKIMLISDTRFGSIYQQTTILNNLYSKASRLGVKHVFLTGDVVEGIYTGAKSIFNTTLHKFGYEDQAQLVADCFPRVDGITTYFLTGEHDLSFLKTKEKVDIGKIIESKREDMIYLGQSRRKVQIIEEGKNGQISLFLQHAKGSVPYTVSYKPQQMINSLRNEDKTDILVTSHFGASDSFLRRGVRSIQVPTVVKTTPEMRSASTPVYNTIGGWIVDLEKDSRGNLKNTKQIWIPYYETIEDDYKTAKTLWISKDKKVYIPQKNKKDEIDKLYSSIKNKEEVDSVLERLNISEFKLDSFIEQFIQKGYNFEIDEVDGKKVFLKKRNYSTKDIKPRLSKLDKISELWISDTHLCNEKQQLHMVNKLYEEAKKKGIDTVLHFGDITDGDYQNRPEHKYALFRLGADRQKDYVISHWPKVDGITTYILCGNHDKTHNKNGGVDIVKAICDARDDLVYVGSDRAIISPKESPKTKIEMFHPGGGCASSLSYKNQKYIEKMEPGTKPNLLGTGHYHQSHVLHYRNVISVIIPCLTAKTDFAITQGLENTMGAYFVDLYVNKKGEVEMFGFEEKRFTQKDVKEDDYEKTKQLVIKKSKK